MAVIKIEALKYLAARIACAIPELEGKICITQSFPNHNLGFPSLAIVPAGRWKFFPDQEGDEVADPAPDRVVVRIGRFEITLQLQLATASIEERGVYEQAIEQFFFSTEGHPGIVYGPVKGCEEDVGVFEASFMLEDDEWIDDKAFQMQSWSFITVLASIPSLATRIGVYSMDQIKLGLVEFDAPAVTATSFDTDPLVERILIHEDGSFTNADDDEITPPLQ